MKYLLDDQEVVDGFLTGEEIAEEEKELQRLFEKDNFVPEDKDPFHLDDDEIEVGPFGWG